MKLQDLIKFNGDYSDVLPDGKSIMVYLRGSVTEQTAYWQLSDYVVSSRVGDIICLIPKK